MPGEVEHYLKTVGTGEIDGHTLLARVDAREVAALIGAARLELLHVDARLVARAGPLHLDDARAHVGEESRAVGAGEHAGEIHDEQAVQRERIVAHLQKYSRALRAPDGAPGRRRAGRAHHEIDLTPCVPAVSEPSGICYAGAAPRGAR